MPAPTPTLPRLRGAGRDPHSAGAGAGQDATAAPRARWLGALAGLPRTAADRGAADGVFERAAAGPDLCHIVVPAGRDRRVAHRDRAVRAGRRALQRQIPVVAVDRPAADPAADRASRAAARLGVGDPAGAGVGDPGARSRRSASGAGPDRACRPRRGVSVGEPGHRHRRLPDRAAAPRGAGRRRRRDAMGLSLRHAGGLGGRALRRELWRLAFCLWADGGADAGRHGHRLAHPRAGRRAPAGGAARPHRARPGRSLARTRGGGPAPRHADPARRAGDPRLCDPLQIRRRAGRHDVEPALRLARLHQGRGRQYRQNLWVCRQPRRARAGRSWSYCGWG